MITFVRVVSNSHKLERLFKMVYHHYARGEQVILHCPNADAARFLDEFLWKYVAESFLPHRITTEATSDPIIITTASLPPRRAAILVNLTAEPSLHPHQFAKVYELFDASHPTKAAVSEHKRAAYALKGLAVEVLD